MSGTKISDAATKDASARQRWAALDSRHERVVDSSDPLLRDLGEDREDRNPPFRAAS